MKCKTTDPNAGHLQKMSYPNLDITFLCGRSSHKRSNADLSCKSTRALRVLLKQQPGLNSSCRKIIGHSPPFPTKSPIENML